MRLEISDLRLKIFEISRLRDLVITILLAFSLGMMAQSNLTYTLRVGTMGENTLLAEFPDVYEAEKVNISIQQSAFSPQTIETLDFAFISEHQPSLADRFDSIYSYTDERGVTWAVWRSKREIKNRGQRVLVGNAYTGFENYMKSHTSTARRTGWLPLQILPQ